jgi:hypothetical protein
MAEVRIADDDFGQRLIDIQLWLDACGFEPSAFSHFYLAPGMIVRVSFNIAGEAEAFAREFGGSVIASRGAADRVLAA